MYLVGFGDLVGDAVNVRCDAVDWRFGNIFLPFLRTVAPGQKFTRYPVRDSFDLSLHTLGQY